MRGHYQTRQHTTKTMPTGIARHAAKTFATDVEGFHRQLGVAVPAAKIAAVVAVAMTLYITQPEVEVFCQPRQHRLIGAGAEAVAMNEVQQRLAAGRRMPAPKSESGGALMRPG